MKLTFRYIFYVELYSRRCDSLRLLATIIQIQIQIQVSFCFLIFTVRVRVRVSYRVRV